MSIPGDSEIRSMLEAVGAETVYYYDGNKTIELRAVFNAEGALLDFPGVAVESASPQVVLLTADVPSLAHGHTFIVRDVTYYAINNQPDAQGVTTVGLSLDVPG